jgi:hypothetical protein
MFAVMSRDQGNAKTMPHEYIPISARTRAEINVEMDRIKSEMQQIEDAIDARTGVPPKSPYGRARRSLRSSQIISSAPFLDDTELNNADIDARIEQEKLFKREQSEKRTRSAPWLEDAQRTKKLEEQRSRWRQEGAFRRKQAPVAATKIQAIVRGRLCRQRVDEMLIRLIEAEEHIAENWCRHESASSH